MTVMGIMAFDNMSGAACTWSLHDTLGRPQIPAMALELAS